MARQFSLVATDIDLQRIQDDLRLSEDVNLLADKPNDTLSGLLKAHSLSISPDDAGKVSLFCYLAPRSLPAIVRIVPESPVKVFIDVQRSNIIEFWRPFYDGKSIRPGRVYYQNRPVVDGMRVEKDEAFCAWADRIMSRIRRLVSLDKKLAAYVGSDARDKLARGIVAISPIA